MVAKKVSSQTGQADPVLIIICSRDGIDFGLMYICICNAMTDREVRAAINAGASDWHEVHSHHGHEPNCGQCECDILDQISRRRGPIISQPLSSSPQVELSGGD